MEVTPHISFSEPEANVVHQQSAPQLNISGPSDAAVQDTSNSSTVVEREEPAVANIISFAGEEEEEEEGDERTELFAEKPTHPPAQPSVRRAKSLKHFTPPPPPVSNHNSPPPSPFSPPATSERVPIINTEKPTPKVSSLSMYGSSELSSGCRYRGQRRSWATTHCQLPMKRGVMRDMEQSSWL